MLSGRVGMLPFAWQLVSWGFQPATGSSSVSRRLLCRWQPGFTRRTLDRVAGVSDDEIRKKIPRVPHEFMSDVAKEFAC